MEDLERQDENPLDDGAEEYEIEDGQNELSQPDDAQYDQNYNNQLEQSNLPPGQQKLNQIIQQNQLMNNYIQRLKNGNLTFVESQRVENDFYKGDYTGMVLQSNTDIKQGYGVINFDDESTYEGLWNQDEPGCRG